MYKRILIFAIAVIITGCTTSPDLQTVSLLNQRLAVLENRGVLPPATAATPHKPYEQIEAKDAPIKVLSIAENIVPEKYEQHDKHENTVIWILMDNGGMLPIRFYIEKGHWVGPLGDHYFHRPTKKQVEVLYKR
jgi:hypothetical protein|tara:strand:+ start:230 stop:631 length:402 start_codon:yes stop_codon:yes gene_type:complete